MPSPRRACLVSLGLCLTLLWSGVAAAQIYVIPRHAGQSRVRTFDFEWNHVDLAFPVGPEEVAHARPAEWVPGVEGDSRGKDLTLLPAPPLRPVPSGTGQVRLYFDGRDREVSERAAAVIREGYGQLVQSFRFVPPDTFPYVLYTSYREFLETNLSLVGEGTLGFTATGGELLLSLPYFGDDRLFERVSTHELAHQFTLQRVRMVRRAADADENPLERIPLWFIEGLAEYATHDGVDAEAEMLARDLVVNAAPERRHHLADFFSQGPLSFLWIYKLGQLRCAFLEETYGKGFLLRVLDASWRLSGRRETAALSFEELLQRLSGDTPERISARFSDWMKRRAFATYLQSGQGPFDLELPEKVPEFIDTLSAAPDGRLLLIRSFDPAGGDVRLQLVDPRAPGDRRTVVRDGVPGAESLNLVFGRTFDLGADRLVYVAMRTGRDVLHVRELAWPQKVSAPVGPPDATPTERSPNDLMEAPASSLLPEVTEAPPPAEEVPARLPRLGALRSYPLEAHGLISAFFPSLSPDGKRVAFSGLTSAGQRDLYVLDLESGQLERLTDDPYAERSLSWGPSGLLYISDATGHRHFNVFRHPGTSGGRPERLTFQAEDHDDPTEGPAGRIFFTAAPDGRRNVHELFEGGARRRTDVATGISSIRSTRAGAIWGLLLHEGRQRPVRVRGEQLEDLPLQPWEDSGPGSPLTRLPLGEATPYQPFRWSNLQPGPLFAFGGAAPQGIYGQVLASATDRLRNHAAILRLAIYGDLNLTDGILNYFNQEQRVTWGGGLFQSLRLRTDRTHPGVPFIHYERFGGLNAMARYPFSRFVYLEVDLGAGASQAFIPSYTRELLSNPGYRDELGLDPTFADYHREWEERVGGPKLQGELSLRAGFDTLRYDLRSGPFDGSSVLLELTGTWRPTTQEAAGLARLDAAHYLHFGHRISLLGQLGLGATVGGPLAQEFFLSSYDTLRGVHFGDPRFLVGRHYGHATLELQVPLNAVMAAVLLSNIEAVLAVDAGGVGDDVRELWDHRVLNAVAGVNLGLGPLVLRLHFALPVEIGARAGTPAAGWVTNFTVGLLGMPGFFRQQSAATSALGTLSQPTSGPWR
ncbi:MAG TPA: tolB protein precursor protein [Myxococcaceae bacterium]|nr:tolB protein precursor protein [Myxococcaceae bacterium]